MQLEASIKLVLAILKAIEHAIGFYTRHQGKTQFVIARHNTNVTSRSRRLGH